MSIDGKTALKNGESKWITSKYARQDVQIFRARSSAILSTSETILKDNPRLNVRYRDFKSIFSRENFRNPIRVIIDSKNRIKKTHKIIHTEGKILLIRLKLDQELWPKNVEQIILKENNKKIDILSILNFLGSLEVNNLWVEAGSTLSGSLLKMKLIDEIIIYIAPKILGNEAKPLFILKNQLKLLECFKGNFTKIKKIGPDIKIILEPVY